MTPKTTGAPRKEKSPEKKLLKWFEFSEKQKKTQVLNTEELSVYDLKKHSKFSFRPLSIVKAKPTQEGKTYGMVVDRCKEGYVIVQWLQGKPENCWPQDIESLSDSEGFTEEDIYSSETERTESSASGDLTDPTVLENMAARLDFVRSRMIYLKDAFKNHTITENFAIFKDLLLVYWNSSYLAKLFGTSSLFSLKSNHVQPTESVATPDSSTPLPLPSFPITPEDSFSAMIPLESKKTASTEEKPVDAPSGGESQWYTVIEESPLTHHYYTDKFEPRDVQKFLKAVMKEHKLLKESLPGNVWVRSYSDRMDLLSVMIRGPAKTPYEDGLFLFDIQLSVDYPRSPPWVHYISYNSERLNPNLYVEGKVCLSLLSTWMGKGTEVWGANSTLLQLIVSIQGLILVSEPYYNEPGYEEQTETQEGYENSRTYNELVVLKVVQSMTELLSNPPEVFQKEILNHFAQNGSKLCQRLEGFCNENDLSKPDFPLLPVSKGLKLSLTAALKQFQDMLERKTKPETCEAKLVQS